MWVMVLLTGLLGRKNKLLQFKSLSKYSVDAEI